MPKLTKRIVDALAPDPAGEKFAWDAEIRGFGVRIMPSGVATYMLKYRNAEGRQRKLALGRVGTLTPDEARQLAREKLGDAARGADPSAERHKLRKSITVDELCDLYLIEAEGRVKPTTYSNNKSHIDRHVKPLIGRHSVLSITAADVAKMQADIVAGKTAAKRKGRGGATTGGKGAASRTIAVFGAVMEFARKRKVVSENVVLDIERLPDQKQRRFLSLAEIGLLGAAMRAPEADVDPPTGIAAVKFLLLSGCRRMEALGCRSQWMDRAASCVRYPDTKSGAQIRPIGQAAFDAIEGVCRDGWAFPAVRGEGHFVGLPKVLARLCKRAKLEGVTVHVLRHSFAAAAAEIGFSELTIAGLLGHTVPGITARYAHVPDSALVIAAGRVSSRIAAALEGGSEPKVVKLRKRNTR